MLFLLVLFCFVLCLLFLSGVAFWGRIMNNLPTAVELLWIHAYGKSILSNEYLWNQMQNVEINPACSKHLVDVEMNTCADWTAAPSLASQQTQRGKFNLLMTVHLFTRNHCSFWYESILQSSEKLENAYFHTDIICREYIKFVYSANCCCSPEEARNRLKCDTQIDLC